MNNQRYQELEQILSNLETQISKGDFTYFIDTNAHSIVVMCQEYLELVQSGKIPIDDLPIDVKTCVEFMQLFIPLCKELNNINELHTQLMRMLMQLRQYNQ